MNKIAPFSFSQAFYFHHFSHIASNYNFKFLFIFWSPAIKTALFLLKHNRNWSDVVAHKEKIVYRIATSVKCVWHERELGLTLWETHERMHTDAHCVCARCELGCSQACGMVFWERGIDCQLRGAIKMTTAFHSHEGQTSCVFSPIVTFSLKVATFRSIGDQRSQFILLTHPPTQPFT